MKNEKQLLLDEIKAQISSKPSFFLAQYSKLTANKANEFRREMAKFGVNFEVVRKRMLLKAAHNCGVTLTLETLKGHIGILSTDNDPVETTKAITKYSDDNNNCLELLVARVEGTMINQTDIKRLSKLPSKNEMRAQFLGLLEAPMSQTLSVFEALLTSVVHCVDNKAQKETNT
jgi:large subunit ribosomal protein L10